MDIILKYFPNLSEVQQQQFAALYDLYTDWNSKINVISRKDITNLYEHHVLHSLGIAKVINFTPGTHVMDLGTGGGFPGIPLAILFPETNFHLVDSIGKKVKVATEVARRYEEAYGGMDDNDSIKWGVVGETRRILGDKVKLGID